MENDEKDFIESQDDTETTENEVDLDFELDEESKEESGDELTTEELKKKIQTLEAQKNHWKKKATAPKPERKIENKEQGSTLSLKDQIALSKSVDVEDIDEVVEFASYKKISITEALKNPTLKSILNEREEYRKSSQATSVGTTRKSTNTISDEVLLENARKGSMPEEKDIERLIAAKFKK